MSLFPPTVAARLAPLGMALLSCTRGPVPLPPSLPSDSPDRKPDAGRVRALEGLALKDFERALPAGAGRQETLEALKKILAGGNPNKLDPGDETVRAAQQFTFYDPHLWPYAIADKDVEAYQSQHNLQKWEARKGEIREAFGLAEANHQFVELFDKLSIKHSDLFRGLLPFAKLAAEAEKLPQVKAGRELHVLYPGSGSHIAPLMTAFELIDNRSIESAAYVFTELEDYSVDLHAVLNVGMEMGLFDGLSMGPREDFGQEGSERMIEVIYKGHPVRIRFALKRSGSAYYREDYLRQADLVVIHDPKGGHLQESFDLLAQILLDKQKGFPSRDQLVVMEGEPRSGTRSAKGETHFPAAMLQEFLQGTYGHCSSVGWLGIGEVMDCEFRSARAFLLNDPALQLLITQHPDPRNLSRAFYTKFFDPSEPRVAP